MPKPNYSFEKRKRELAKKAAKEAKKQKKDERAKAPEDATTVEKPAEDSPLIADRGEP